MLKNALFFEKSLKNEKSPQR